MKLCLTRSDRQVFCTRSSTLLAVDPRQVKFFQKIKHLDSVPVSFLLAMPAFHFILFVVFKVSLNGGSADVATNMSKTIRPKEPRKIYWKSLTKIIVCIKDLTRIHF